MTFVNVFKVNIAFGTIFDMNWTCPHKVNDETCRLQKTKCKPMTRGCVLAKKTKCISPKKGKGK